ncbi:MAG: ribonuclease J, partial [Mycoplasmataceae bacterium]|nr:ribonuclease J [Mycoplasmataceae bacterium]
ALGGLDENGKNSYVLEVEKDIYVINTGTKIPISSSHGIDTLIPDFSYLEDNASRIKGLFITDVQNESFSALPWLLMKVPNITIYCSSFSNFLIEERISKYDVGKSNYKIKNLSGNEEKIGSIFVEKIELAGALPGTLGFNFKTPDGSVIFLFNFVDGDLGAYGRTNIAKIKEKNENILALVLDSGMANFNGVSSEHIDIKKLLDSKFSLTSNTERIIIGSYDHEMSSLQQILDLAKKYNRTVITYGRIYHQLLEFLINSGQKLDLPKIVDYKKIKEEDNCVIIVSGTVERLYKRFVRITDDNDVYLKIRNNDHIIMIATPVNGLETESTYALDELARKTPHIIDYTDNEFYHCRPAKDDVYNIVKLLKPKYFIPAQGLYRYMIVAVKEAIRAGMTQNRTIPMQNGKIASFTNGELISQKERIANVGDIIIDGFGVGDISKEVIYEREVIARDGVIAVSVLYDKKNKKLFDHIDIKYIGVITAEEREGIDILIENIVIEVYYRELKLTTKFNLYDIQDSLRKIIRKKIFKLTDKEPMIVIIFNEI